VERVVEKRVVEERVVEKRVVEKKNSLQLIYKNTLRLHSM
jgi:hypothetical protein